MDTFTPVESLDRQTLCRLDDIPDGGATAVDARLPEGEESLILLRQGMQVRGYLNVCPHAGRRLDYAPGKFLLKNDTLTCCVHGAAFNRADGLCIGGPCRGEHLRAVAVQVEAGEVRLAQDGT
ncbi:Rieske (2Fe-2S) protein [Rhodanobacter thiooxydans]|uniref:Rieske (2Fe-2S) protein n=1 Tax=Rhodanobacter thiooxydans TaxID=416169 RepID=UPI000D396FE1|nr:Rieske 2Fe-2S domain-containing protein [Rhodanobacter thiooxydans]